MLIFGATSWRLLYHFGVLWRMYTYVTKMVCVCCLSFWLPVRRPGYEHLWVLTSCACPSQQSSDTCPAFKRGINFWTKLSAKLAEQFSNEHCLGCMKANIWQLTLDKHDFGIFRQFWQFLIFVCLSRSCICLHPRAKNCSLIGMGVWC